LRSGILINIVEMIISFWSFYLSLKLEKWDFVVVVVKTNREGQLTIHQIHFSGFLLLLLIDCILPILRWKKRENWDEMDWEKNWLRDKILKLKSISKPQFLALQLKILKYLLGVHIWYHKKKKKEMKELIEKIKIHISKSQSQKDKSQNSTLKIKIQRTCEFAR